MPRRAAVTSTLLIGLAVTGCGLGGGSSATPSAGSKTTASPTATALTSPGPLNFTVNLAENLKRLGLTPDLLLPLHGRIVPVADLHKAVGHEH